MIFKLQSVLVTLGYVLLVSNIDCGRLGTLIVCIAVITMEVTTLLTTYCHTVERAVCAVDRRSRSLLLSERQRLTVGSQAWSCGNNIIRITIDSQNTTTSSCVLTVNFNPNYYKTVRVYRMGMGDL